MRQWFFVYRETYTFAIELLCNRSMDLELYCPTQHQPHAAIKVRNPVERPQLQIQDHS